MLASVIINDTGDLVLLGHNICAIKATLSFHITHVMFLFTLFCFELGYFVSLGAGSCLEVLGAGKPLLVVVNDKLMDNHQLELAKKLQADGHLLYCTCRFGSI